MTVAVLGSTALDVLLAPEGLEGALGTVGNSGSNIAIRLAAAGEDVLFLTAVGDDAAGEAVRRSLAAAGVDPAGVMTVAGARTPIVFQRPSADGSPDFSIDCPRCGAAGERPRLPAAADLPSALRDRLATVDAVITDVDARELLTLVPEEALFWLEAGAPYAERTAMAAQAPTAHIVKWSADEVAGEADAAAASSASWLLRTRGADGIELMRGTDAPQHVPAVAPSRLVDSMGAGDAVTAAVIHTLLNARAADDAALLAACRAGAAAGARACEAFGARGDVGDDGSVFPVEAACARCEDVA